MRKYTKLIFFLIMVASLFLLVPMQNNRCVWQKEFDEKRIYGIVLDKYLDSLGHLTPIIKIQNIKDGSINIISFLGEESSIYSAIRRSDTLYKGLGNEVYIKKLDKLKKIGNVDFGCDK